MWRCEECCHCPRPNLLCALLRWWDLSQKYYHHLELGEVCLIWQMTRKTSYCSGVRITFLNSWRRRSSISAKSYINHPPIYLSIYLSNLSICCYKLWSQMKSAVAEKLQQNVSPGASNSSNTGHSGHQHNWPSPHYMAATQMRGYSVLILDTWIFDRLVCSSLHFVSSFWKKFDKLFHLSCTFQLCNL